MSTTPSGTTEEQGLETNSIVPLAQNYELKSVAVCITIYKLCQILLFLLTTVASEIQQVNK